MVPIITLTTDFGLKDGNVGVMKGVIWSIAPQALIADLSHTISPQNIAEASLVVARATPFFPAGTIHVVVVDPGVGTERRPIAIMLGSELFVGPDNGVFTRVLERAEQESYPIEIIHLDKHQYWLPEVSNVFHGRDIFAPVAGHLATGIELKCLGTPIYDPVRLRLPQPKPFKNSLRGEVIHIDHFGNIHSNIRIEHSRGTYQASVSLRGATIRGFVHAFGERPPGELVALYGSSGDLIISVVNGSAAELLGAKVGDAVEVIL